MSRPASARPHSATSELMQRSKIRCYSITSSARASTEGRHFKAERLGGLEVDHQFVLGRRLHRQVGRFLAPEDAIDVAGRAPVLVDDIRTVAGPAAIPDEVWIRINSGQSMAGWSSMIRLR